MGQSDKLPPPNYRGGGPVTPNLGRARRLRSGTTDAEARIWHHLRSSQLAELKFRRQHPFGPFILDFYCPALKLAVELDGGQHGEPATMAADQRRSAYLARRGIRVLRFSDYDALSNTEGVILEILKAAGVSLDAV
jgi:very-short-patch-repair endonuclease